MTQAITVEQVTPFLARMKKLGLKVAIVHAGATRDAEGGDVLS